MPEFRIDVTLHATLYVEAANKAEAIRICTPAIGKDEFIELGHDDLYISDDVRVRLSPAMTSAGFDADAIEEAE